jgi:luciferase family oxidoreductase group 1
LPYAFAGHFAPKQMHQAFQYYREHFQASKLLDQPKIMACVNAVAADTDEEAEKLATSLTQMFLNLIRNDRKPLQPPVDSLDGIMSEEEHFHVNQMTSCSFVGSKKKLEIELKEFIDYTRIDELMITSPIYNHEAKLKSIRIMKEVIDTINLS